MIIMVTLFISFFYFKIHFQSIDENIAKLKGLNVTDVIKTVQDKYPNLSDVTKSVLKRITN